MTAILTPAEAAELHEAHARMLAEVSGLLVTAVYGGFRVRDAGTHWVDVTRQIYNWRVCMTPKDDPSGCYDRHWCYEGTSWVALLTAVLAVAEWDGREDTEPAGWLKNGQTGELRRPGVRS